MRLPKDLLSGNYTRPRLFLCETNKDKITQLDVTNLNGSFKFNAYSELTFEIARTYNDLITGEIKVFPYYDKVEALRLLYLENFGYFEIQGPELTGDGIKEAKNITAYSYEYVLSTKYLEDFYINQGTVESLEVLNADNPDNIIPITLYNPNNTKLSLLHLILEKAYGWSIGHVDFSLQTLSRQFEVDRESIYDFLMNEVCEKFNCYIVFDTINNTINVYAESLTSKFIGDGATNVFTISPPFSQIGTVSVDGYKTTRWEYNSTTGALTLEDIPVSGAHVEVVDGALTEWETDVFVTFDNLSQEININYDADSIKTQLTVTYGDDLDIREANMGLPYITDLSYYYTVDWMGQELYDAYTAYIQKSNQYQSEYTNNSQKMLELAGYIDFEENRLSLEYSIANSVNETTIGTYYIRGGTAPNYYYTEVTLPADYNVNTTYYSMDTANLDETKVENLYAVLKKYFNNESNWAEELDKLSTDFKFMETYTLTYLKTELSKVTDNRTSNSEVESAINNFLAEMWEQIGRTPLKSLYYESYKQVQITNIEAGWSQGDSNNYGYYYPVVLYLNSIEKAIAARESSIAIYEEQYNKIQKSNSDIANGLIMENNFTKDQLIRLSAFIREDELKLDDIVETEYTTIAESFQLKQDAMESGRIELQKLCQPQLQFSMSMANIYALPEFEPIVDQFQLGNVIKVGLRSDYVKQSRLLQVDINFDDFSDFSCEFGELTNLRTQSDIHADLLKNAISAGKSVATNAGNWTSGADRATATDLKIQQGLLDANTRICAIDGTQNVVIDKYGIKLQKQNPDTGEIDPKQAWFCNNNLLFTSDNWRTTRMGIGEFSVEDLGTFYGVIAEAILSGYIESSTMVGGTIKIGLQDDGRYAFEVHEDGSVTMSGGSSIEGYAKEDYVKNEVEKIQNQVDNINTSKMYKVEIVSNSSTIISTSEDKATLTCKVYSWDSDITDTLDTSLFNWKRVSTSTELDDIWNAMPEHKGTKSIIIDADDVYYNSSFTCEVNLPE